MKLIIIIASMVAASAAIRVPIWPTNHHTVNPNNNNNHHLGYITYPNTYKPPNYDRNGFVVDANLATIINPYDPFKQPPHKRAPLPVVPLRYTIRKKVVEPQKKNRKKIIHLMVPQKQKPQIIKPYFHHNHHNHQDVQLPYDPFGDAPHQESYERYKEAVIRNNYRDDVTHEQLHLEEIDPHDEHNEEVFRHEDERAPVSDHEYPQEVPTKPIYPGEGVWAKPGRKHKPFVSKQKYTDLSEDNERPDGYEVFERGQGLFERQKKIHKENLKAAFPQEDNKEELNRNNFPTNNLDFIPTRLYAQVRRTEDEKHVGIDPDEPRLREVIKDTKVQTVYSEEGYEDSAYDHAGHEKNAEHEEGSSGFLGNEGKKLTKINQYDDSESDGSDYNEEKTDLTTDESVYPYSDFNRLPEMKFTKTQEVKTTEIKEMGDGNVTYQIASEVKVATSPDNKTTTQKFVKIFPMFVVSPEIDSEDEKEASGKNAEDAGDDGKVVEDVDGLENAEKNFGGMENEAEKNQEKIVEAPETIPEDPLDDIFDPGYTEILKLPQNNSRTKRNIDFKNDFPKIEIETFEETPINPTSGTFNNFQEIKFPYYKLRNLHRNSPLRYAETYTNIPNKQSEKMAFYDMQDKKIECSEVTSEIDPIPNRVKNAENHEAKDVEEQPDGPRLSGLGDKIDCFKLRYFGEDPLDSPIFKEESVGRPEPIFFELAPVELNEIKESQEAAPTVKGDVVVEADGSKNVEGANEDVTTVKEESETTTVAVPFISIITTPKYTVQLTPKHIYDQIHLLDYLPNVNVSTAKEASVSPSNETPQKIKDFEVLKLQPENLNTTRKPRLRVINATNENFRNLEISKWQKRPIKLDIFDITAFLPSTVPTYTQHPTNTQPIKRKAISEVHYKDEIKPNEQLNVFEDVLKIIKNSNETQSESSSIFRPQVVLRTKKRRKKIRRKNQNRFRLPILDQFSSGAEVTEKLNIEEFVEKPVVEVVGLVPPGHKTIYGGEERVVNLFPVIGMKPPASNQRLLNYGDYNFVKRRRSKRSAGKGGYVSIRRDSGKVEEEDEDLEPHRPKNYHYDEASGRIVYDNVASTTGRAITSTTTRTTSTTSEKPAGKNWFEYVQLVKNHKDYQYIPEPEKTSTEAATAPTTTKSVTEKPKGQPEFLKILSKVKNDEKYISIPDKDIKSSTTTTTTEEPEINPPNIQNAPGAAIQPEEPTDNQQTQTEDLKSTKKNFNPKTNIDTTKYKTIVRGAARRMDEEDSESAATNHEEETTTEAPKANRVVLKRLRTRRPLQRTTTTTEASRSRLLGRNRNRKEVRTLTATPRVVTEDIIGYLVNETRKHEVKARKVDDGGGKGNNGGVDDKEDAEVLGVVDEARKHGGNYREEGDVDGDVNGDVKEDVKEEVKETVSSSGDRKKDVLLFKKYDKSRRHGGNYKGEETVKEELKEEDTVPEDTKKDVLLFKKFDKSRRHGGNYRKLEDTTTSSSPSSSSSSPPPVSSTTTKPSRRRLSEAEVFKKFDKSRKHGGNYRRKEETKTAPVIEDPKTTPFFEDPKLAGDVNKLKEPEDKVKLDKLVELELIEADVDDGEGEERVDDFVEEERKGDLDGGEGKVVYVKDPFKRAYMVAPV